MFQQAKQIGVAASRIFPISYPFRSESPPALITRGSKQPQATTRPLGRREEKKDI